MGVVAYIFYKKVDLNTLSGIDLTWVTTAWLFVAILMMATRDIGYMIRLRILTEGKLSWKKIFRIIMLWEFTSAISPSAIGGTSVAILYVNKAGLSVGKSSAIVMATSFLDELYFILMFPLLFLIVSGTDLFTIIGDTTAGEAISFTNTFFYFAVIGWSIKFLYVCFLFYGLFANPRGIKWLLLWFFRLPILRKWKHGANQAGTEIIKSSKELKKKPFSFWLKAFGATFISWTSRYWVVNVILLAFFVVNDHFLIFARQLVMWIMMLVSPTPGGSGFSEYVFYEYLQEFMPKGFAPIMALLWRFATFYPYLIAGAIILPKWINNNMKIKPKK